MKNHRVFIAINLPERIKKRLLMFQKQWAGLPIRWTRESNLHITLAFLGNVDDEEILEICRLGREIAEKCEPFEIRLKRICLGPPHGAPRMIWVEGEDNPALNQLRNDLEKVLFYSNQANKNKAFRPHITLAKIRQSQWRDLPAKPEGIDREISLDFSAGSIEVMESYLSKSGPDYVVLESLELGK